MPGLLPAILLLLLIPLVHFAQEGGSSTYDFLRLTASARSAANGGSMISARDGDASLVYDNPAILEPSMAKNASLSYVNYFTDIHYGYAGYAHEVEKFGSLAAGIFYLNYGKFTEADETGLKTGSFGASEYAIHLSHSRPLDSLFSIGAAIKPVYSKLGTYSSFGLSVDIGGTYESKNRKFSAGAVIKNSGMQLITYTRNNREPLPFEIQAGITKILSHAPFRISVTAKDLQKWDLTYEVKDNISAPATAGSAEEIKTKLITADKLMKHLSTGVEFFPSRSFTVRLGYDYRRRQELRLSSRAGLGGISFGLAIKVSGFHISYTRAAYHFADASNHLSLSTNLASLYTRN